MIWQLAYNVYFNFFNECYLENYLYDLSEFCFENECTFDKFVQNELGKVFQVTGALNALAAIYYDPAPSPDQHTAWFDMYS